MPEKTNADDQRKPSLLLKDALELALTAGDKIDNDWRQYFTVAFGLLAYVSSNLTKIHLPEATIVSAGIIFFSMFNAVALVRQYIVIDLLVDEAASIALISQFASERVHEQLTSRPYRFKFPYRKTACFLAHMLAAAGIIYLVFKDVPLGEITQITQLLSRF
jgi:hypothetical protein